MLRRRRNILRSGGTLCFPLTSERHNPDVRGLLVRREIHIDRGEQNPLAIRRRHRLADALQLHHVFESEWMLDLGEGGKSQRKNEQKSKEQKNQTAHDVPPRNKRV